MTRSIPLAAALLVALAGCNKHEEVVVNDPMANDVVSLPEGEGNALVSNGVGNDVEGGEPTNATAANISNAVEDRSGGNASSGAATNATGNSY
jgi:hypothetical protein